jgi:hypothetical protein
LGILGAERPQAALALMQQSGVLARVVPGPVALAALERLLAAWPEADPMLRLAALLRDDGKLDGVSIRVPTPNVSVVDFKFLARKATTVEEINAAVTAAAEGELKGILGYTNEKLVSSDFNHDPHSSVFHMDQTKVLDGVFVRVMSWYDNEWGFSNRMADTAVAMGKLI